MLFNHEGFFDVPLHWLVFSGWKMVDVVSGKHGSRQEVNDIVTGMIVRQNTDFGFTKHLDVWYSGGISTLQGKSGLSMEVKTIRTKCMWRQVFRYCDDHLMISLLAPEICGLCVSIWGSWGLWGTWKWWLGEMRWSHDARCSLGEALYNGVWPSFNGATIQGLDMKRVLPRFSTEVEPLNDD